jgi:hypothetical protein
LNIVLKVLENARDGNCSEIIRLTRLVNRDNVTIKVIDVALKHLNTRVPKVRLSQGQFSSNTQAKSVCAHAAINLLATCLPTLKENAELRESAFDKIRESVDEICAWLKFLLVVDFQLTPLRDQKVLFKFQEGSMGEYLGTSKLICALLNLDDRLRQDLFSTNKFFDLAVWLWTAKDEGGSLWLLQKSSDVSSGRCSVQSLMSSIIYDDNGREGLLVHLGSLPRKDIVALVESIVERAKLFERSADSHPTERSMKLLVELFDVVVALEKNIRVQRRLSASHSLTTFSSALERVSQSLSTSQPKRSTTILVYRGITALGALATLGWGDLLAGKFLLTLARALAAPIAEHGNAEDPWDVKEFHEVYDTLLEGIASRIAFPSVLSRLALGLTDSELASIPLNENTEDVWKVIHAVKEYSSVYQLYKDVDMNSPCDYPKVRLPSYPSLAH